MHGEKKIQQKKKFNRKILNGASIMNSYYRRYQENTFLLNICKTVMDIVMVVLAAYVIVSFACTRTTISGGSMEDTIKNEDTVLINRFAYAFGSPKRFDCIAFEPDAIGSSKLYVKRVVGLPGETIQIKEGHIYINGNILENDINDTYIVTAGMAINEIHLGEDEYFCLGDNRNNSEDSRFSSIGMIKKEHIVGKVWMVLHPIEDMRFVK